MLQLVYPINIASADATKVVPEWVRSLVPVVEPRLDAATNGTTGWYLVADPAQIDTVEYCYLEGQQACTSKPSRVSKWTASRSRRAWISVRRRLTSAACKRTPVSRAAP